MAAPEFKSLQQALAYHNVFTLPEILLARTSSAYLGLFEQLKTCFGPERVQAAMHSLAEGLNTRIATPQELASVDLKKINNVEIHRLMLKLKAFPLGVSSDNKYLHLIVSDPFCIHTRSCFSKFFSCQVLPILAWETEIQKKLMNTTEGSGTYRSLSDSSASMAVVDTILSKNHAHASEFENLLLEVFKFDVSEFKFEFEKKRILVHLTSVLKKKKSISLNLNPEEFVAFLLGNSRLIEISDNGFSAWTRVNIFKQSFSFKSSFLRTSLAGNFVINNVLAVNEFSSNPVDELARFYMPLAEDISGIFFIEEEGDSLTQALKKAYPAAYFPSLQELVNKENYSTLAVSCPIFVKAKNAKDYLPQLAEPLLKQICGILHNQQVEQKCGFCSSAGCCFCETFSAKLNMTWLELPKIENNKIWELENNMPAKYIFLEKLKAELTPLIKALKPEGLIPYTESPLFCKPPSSGKKAGFHSVVLKMGDAIKSMREEEQTPSLEEKPPVKKPQVGFHSVVIGMDDDLMAMREKLKQDEKKDPKK